MLCELREQYTRWKETMESMRDITFVARTYVEEALG